jgi:hypothetical protein
MAIFGFCVRRLPADTRHLSLCWLLVTSNISCADFGQEYFHKLGDFFISQILAMSEVAVTSKTYAEYDIVKIRRRMFWLKLIAPTDKQLCMFWGTNNFIF